MREPGNIYTQSSKTAEDNNRVNEVGETQKVTPVCQVH